MMAVFNSNKDFDTIDEQLQYVRTSLRFDKKEEHYGCCRRGDGWTNPFYYVYCNRCQMEIERPFIHPDDEEKLERCPECKDNKDLIKKQERLNDLKERMNLLIKEEKSMKKQVKKWRIFRRKHPLNPRKKNEDDQDDEDDDDYYDDSDYSDSEYYDDFDDDYDDDIDDEKRIKLEYDENIQWVSSLDVEAYIVNNWYIPNKKDDAKERAKRLYEPYKICKKQLNKAIKEKNLGNTAYSSGNYEVAIKHYTASILDRTDYKIAYTNRALAYTKLCKYDECIMDCTMVIDMIQIVNKDTMLKSNEIFKAYLRRGNAYKLQNKYENAICDLEKAALIKPKDGSVNKVLSETKILLKRIKQRKKLQNEMLNVSKRGSNDDEKALNDFDYIFNLSVEFLQSATSITDIDDGFNFEGKHSEELLRRLYVFLSQNKKYCVRFADQNGIELCLKYLHKKFKILKKYNMENEDEKKEKMSLLEKPFILLNHCCDKTVNFTELKNKKYLKLINLITLFTFGYFGEMTNELQVQSMRFVSIALSIDSIRDHISNKSGNKLILYLIKWQKRTNPLKQNTNSIRCLFEVISSLNDISKFKILLFKHRAPYLYEIFFHSLYIYYECIENKKKHSKLKLNDYENLQYSISVLFDCLSTLFQGEVNDDQILQKQSVEMVKHFISNKNINKFMELIQKYISSTYIKYKQYNNENKEIETERYYSQIIKSFNILVQLSYPSFTSLGIQSKLYQYPIHNELISFMLICKDSYNHRYNKMIPMLKIHKNQILRFVDHISENEQFDILIMNKASMKFLCDEIIEEYKEKQYSPALMERFVINKASSIRTIYRWTLRCVQQENKESVLFNLMIKKYFEEFMEWLQYKDEQIVANLPLVISQCIKYSKNIKTKLNKNQIFKLIKKKLTQKRLKSIMKIMKMPHDVIQYNSCLLMANIIEFDQEISKICYQIGAVGLLEAYKQKRANNKQKQLI